MPGREKLRHVFCQRPRVRQGLIHCPKREVCRAYQDLHQTARVVAHPRVQRRSLLAQ